MQSVSVIITKVIQIGEKHEVKPGLFKQDVTISDKTTTMKLTLWQNDIDHLENSKSYQLDNLEVKSYNASKYLSPPKTGLCCMSHPDINEVVCEPNTCSLDDEILDAEVVGVNDVYCHS